jgi:tRNA(Ile)-lysidine synthase
MTGASHTIAVAVSGGRDSTALLHCVARAARGTDIRVLALHVHHGLQPDADAWASRLRALCARWHRAGLPVHFDMTRLQGGPQPGDSIEAWARRERYRALARMAQRHGCGTVLLAHHQRDQAETFVLQALRGAGPAGLAAMPHSAQRDDILWVRPWLDVSPQAIDAYLRRHRLAAVEDPSNAQPRFARSRLRTMVWPVLEQAFPDADGRLSAAAARAHEAHAALADYVRDDLRSVVDGSSFLVEPWRLLHPARRPVVLRAWLDAVLTDGVPQSLIDRLLRELPAARSSARWPAPDGVLVLHRGRLVHAGPPQPRLDVPPAGSVRVDLSRPGVVVVAGWDGAFHVCTGPAGLSEDMLRDVSLRRRAGGERFALAPKALPRSLKKQYQTLGVPAWQRAGPLAWSGGELLYAPGLGIEAGACARHPGLLHVEWVPNAPDTRRGR